MNRDEFPPDVLKDVAEQLSDFLEPQDIPTSEPVTVSPPIQMWTLDETRLLRLRFPHLVDTAVCINLWHHQLRQGVEAIAYARSALKSSGVEVLEVGGRDLAMRVEKALAVLNFSRQRIAELRLLDLPNRHLVCLWSISSGNKQKIVIVPCVSSGPLKENHIYTEHEFLKNLKSIRWVMGLSPLQTPEAPKTDKPSGSQEAGIANIAMDGNWLVEDLGEFGHNFNDVYSFTYWEMQDNGRIPTSTYVAYPWRGGWSRTDFFRDLYNKLPEYHRPKISKIAYASPGNMTLALWTPVVEKIGSIIRNLLNNTNGVDQLINDIGIELRRRHLGMDAPPTSHLKEDDRQFVTDALGQLGVLLSMDTEALSLRTSDILISLKMLIAYYIRIRRLVELQGAGKISIN